MRQENETATPFDQVRRAGSPEELLAALTSPGAQVVEVLQDLHEVPSFRLRPGMELRGSAGTRPTIFFKAGEKGVELTADNCLKRLGLSVQRELRAVWNSPESDSFGRVELEELETIGSIRIILQNQNGKAHLSVQDVWVRDADTTAELEQPRGYGVSVVRGAFTLWNKRSGRTGAMTADLVNIAVGLRDAPVHGGGVFLCGARDEDCSLQVGELRTGAVYSDGRIPDGTADRISGGIFLVYGTAVDLVENRGPVMTFGANDMALDSWGTIDRWIARGKVTTWGPSAIGFVTFGSIESLLVLAPIETHGLGARGYNVYSGTVRKAEFERIVTRGDGAVGIQISRPVGMLKVHDGIVTHGAIGQSLVKGVLQDLPAIALSLRQGASADEIVIKGGLRTHAKDVPALEQAGQIGRLVIEGGFGGQQTAASE